MRDDATAALSRAPASYNANLRHKVDSGYVYSFVCRIRLSYVAWVPGRKPKMCVCVCAVEDRAKT